MGSRLGKFELLTLWNESQQTQLWHAKLLEGHHTGCEVTLKCLTPSFQDNPICKELLLSEGALLAQLEHPNIVDLLESGEADDTPYLALEYVNGVDLNRLLQRCLHSRVRIADAAALGIARQVGRALDAIHRFELDGKAGLVVHRNLRPQQVLISYDGFIGDPLSFCTYET